mgnify:CR=1 FL=1
MIDPGPDFYKAVASAKPRNTLRGGNPREGYPLRRARSESFDATWLRSNPKQLVALCRLQSADTPLVVTTRRRKINHVIRTGLRPNFLFVDEEGNPQKKTNKLFSRRFKKWSRRVEGKSTKNIKISFATTQRLARNELFSSGEFFVKKIIDRSDPTQSPLRLQLIDRDQLDTSVNKQTDSGYIKQGIEYNAKDQEVAYWMYTRYPGDALIGTHKSVRIPADWMIHVFDPERVTQRVGVPEASSTVMTNGDLEDYLGAALQQARSDAQNYGILTGGAEAEDLQAFNSPNQVADGPTPDCSYWPVEWGQDGELSNETVINMDGGGRITVLPEGKFEAPNPNTPNSNLPQFAATQSRRAALPVGNSYELSTGDFSQTSFSGAMAAGQHSAVDFECDQFIFIEKFLDIVMEWWLETEWLYGPPEVKRLLSDYGVDPDQYMMQIGWQYNGEQTLNPLQNVNAAAKKVELGISSRRTEAAAIGENFDDNMENQLEELDVLIAREKKRLELLRLTEERTALEAGKSGQEEG